jgi:hypothetical protein
MPDLKMVRTGPVEHTVIDHANGAGLEEKGVIRDVETRFLYPFLFQRGRLLEAIQGLRSVELPGVSKLWEVGRPVDAYTKALIDSAAPFVTGGGESPASSYLKVGRETGRAWFDGARLQVPDHGCLAIKQTSNLDIELFLSNHGAGVLSIPLTPAETELNKDVVLAFNYYLSHAPHGVATEIHIPHPAEDQKKWAQMLVSARENVKPAPGRFALLEDRLGTLGGTFTLAEIISRLLLPLEALGLQALQRDLMLHTVAQVEMQNGMEQPNLQGSLAAFLGELADVHDPKGSAKDGDVLHATAEAIGTGHWAATGQGCAAHLVADRTVGPRDGAEAGDHLLLTLARDVYFIPYCLALQQRIVLQTFAQDARALSLASDKDVLPRLTNLRADLARLRTTGSLTEVSTDLSVERFYHACMDKLGVDGLWKQIRDEIGEMETQSATNRQLQAASDAARQLAAMAELQKSLKWLQILAASLYAAILYHFIASQNETVSWLFRWFGFQWGEIIFAGLGFVIAYRWFRD